MYRYLIKEYKIFATYRAAKSSRDWNVRHGILAAPIEIDCPVHGWQVTTWGQCCQCKERENGSQVSL